MVPFYIKMIKDVFLKVLLNLKLGEILALIAKISEIISYFYFPVWAAWVIQV